MRDTILFALLAVLYTGVLGTGSWHLLRAEQRNRWRRHFRSLWQGAIDRATERRRSLLHKATTGGQRLSLRPLRDLSIRHKRPIAIASGLLLIPALITLCIAPHVSLDAYDDLPANTDPVVMTLLRGEQLVPPPAIPPEAFITAEIAVERPQIASASREWTLLDADFRQRLLVVYQLMERHGYQMALLEGYRSPERQAMLARLGPQVTNAGANQSYHQYGLAADSAFYRAGKVVISEKDPWAMEGYRLYGQYAESVGLVWGGRWQMMDFGHVELRRAGVLRSR